MLSIINLDLKISSHLYDTLADEYDNYYNLPIHKIEDEFVNNELRTDKYLNGILLDVGCGTGYLLDNNLISSWKYTGIDISKEMILNAKLKHKNHNFKVMDIKDFRLDNNFDNVLILFGCLSYIKDKSIAIENIRNSLSKDGKFFIMFCGSNYRSRKSYIFNNYPKCEEHNLYLLSDAEILDLFKDFKEVKITSISTKASELLGNILPYKYAKLYFNFERKYLSKLFKNQFYCKIVTGKKNASSN